MKIVQVTDTHMVPPGTALLGIRPRERLEACIADINAHHGDAACCILTGDLADRGAPAAYEELRAALENLQVPWHLLIGNHDDREAFKAAFPETPCDPEGFVQQSFDTEAGRFILLDTHEPGTHAGSYCAARAAWLAAQLDAAGERPVYLFMHHPPFEIGIPGLDRIRLFEPEGLAAVLAGRPSVRHIFLGHVHRPVSGSWQGIPFSALRSTVHQVPLDFETADRAPYSLEPPAYAVIFLDPGRTLVHLHDYLDETALPDGMPRYTKLV
jgi:3',5'-cyclic AMP phosphodiesterase CpdA